MSVMPEPYQVSWTHPLSREDYEHLPTRFAKIEQVKSALRDRAPGIIAQVFEDMDIELSTDMDGLEFTEEWEFSVTTDDMVSPREQSDEDWNTATLTLSTNVGAM